MGRVWRAVGIGILGTFLLVLPQLFDADSPLNPPRHYARTLGLRPVCFVLLWLLETLNRTVAGGALLTFNQHDARNKDFRNNQRAH